jgi:hypothetical protein
MVLQISETAVWLYGQEAALWLHAGSLTLEYAGHALSRYDVERSAGTD